MSDPHVVKRIRAKYRALSGMMDERMRRQWAASEVSDLGWGGVSAVAEATGYSLQANRKTREGASHPDRNSQFEHLNRQVPRFQRDSQPVISVDTKKKELVGEFKNPGQEWEIKGQPTAVGVHDFPDLRLGKAIPYGVYDLASNEGWVNVGMDHDTAEFAAASIRRWWQEMGLERFPRATRLMITADGGGSNSSRNRLWKVALQQLADQTGLRLDVCHFPPGTSKWNKIEHRLFCFITKNWRGRPLTGYQVIVNLIANTTASAGLVVRAALDTTKYEPGISVSDEGLAHVTLYLEPVATLDVDVFVTFRAEAGSLQVNPQPVLEYLKARGARIDGEHVVIAGWPVQFLPPNSPLVEEALAQAVEQEVEAIHTHVFTAEHLAAVRLQTGRAKDKARLLQFVEANALDFERFQAIVVRHDLAKAWTKFSDQFLDP